ncbi:MAG: hypothetical protein Q8N18_19355 [Opitutaceae bacterium]|nr:hypothetical protein [Opitutaceae bacterium]
MNRSLVTCFVVACMAVALRAGPKEDAIIAIMRLSEAANYSWTATVADDARTYDIEGRTLRGGFTRVKMPLITAVRRKLGRSATDTQAELIFRGNVECVVLTENGWVRPADLPEPIGDESDFSHPAGATGPASIPRPRGGAIMRPSLPPGPGAPRKRTERPTAYSNLQLAISHPHEDLGVILSGHADFNLEADLVSGTLSELAALLLLVRDGQGEITPLRAEGSFRVWLGGGMVTKYQVQLQGLLRVKTRAGTREIAVQQSTVTQIKQVGTTKVEVPDEARFNFPP